MDFFHKKNYPLQGTSSGADGTSLNTTDILYMRAGLVNTAAVLDTGAGPNLTCEEWHRNAWSRISDRTGSSQLPDAGNEHMKVSKAIQPQVRLGDFTIKIWFG